MPYRYGRKPHRDPYEEHFQPMDMRDASLHRVVNIVNKRSFAPPADFDFTEDQWFNDPPNYHEAGNYHRRGNYQRNDYRCFDEKPSCSNRNSSPRQEGPYSMQHYNRDDLRHYLHSRHGGRSRPYFQNRGRGLGPHQRSLAGKKSKTGPVHLDSSPVSGSQAERGEKPREDQDGYRHSQTGKVSRDRSPSRRKPQLAGSNAASKDFSPNREKGAAQQREKHNAATCHIPSSPAGESPCSSASSTEKPSPGAVGSEEASVAGGEPKQTDDEVFTSRRSEAIADKALEIEKHYRQDCQTFCTVVKMLVAKEPSLETLLQKPLEENLSELKQHCLDDLRHFVKELDEVLESHNASA